MTDEQLKNAITIKSRIDHIERALSDLELHENPDFHLDSVNVYDEKNDKFVSIDIFELLGHHANSMIYETIKQMLESELCFYSEEFSKI